MRLFVLILISLSLTACNSVYIKPHTLDTDAMIFVPRGGAGMERSIKEEMEKRNYKLNIGRLKHVSEIKQTEIYQITNDSKYAVNVEESKETLRPIWCVFNGFWWWTFNVSIIERENNNELLSWRGRGCANSSLRKLNKYLDELEMKKTNAQPQQTNIKSDDTAEIVAVLTQMDEEDKE